MFCINVQYNQVRLGSAQHAVGCAVPCTKTCCRRDILRKAGPARQRVQYWTHTRHGAQRSNMHYAGEGLITNVASVTLCVGELFKTRPTAHSTRDTTTLRTGHNDTTCTVLAKARTRTSPSHFASDDCSRRDDTQHAAHGTRRRYVHCAVSCQELSPSHIASESCSGRDDTQHTAIEQQ